MPRKTPAADAAKGAAAATAAAPPVHEWDQQPGETAKAFEGFTVYLGLGPGRTFRDAYRVHARKPHAVQAGGVFSSWTKAHRWAERAQAYDRTAREQMLRAYVERDLSEHLDTYRATMIEGAESNLAMCETAKAKLQDALAGLDMAGAKVTEVTAMIRAVKDLQEASQNTLGAALGVHHLYTMLQGEGLPKPSTQAPGDGPAPSFVRPDARA